MMSKLIRVVSFSVMVSMVAMLGVPGNASALLLFFSKGSVDATIDLGAGGAPDTDVQLLFLADIREIGGTCKNPQGKSETAQGKPYQLHGVTFKRSNADSFVETENGHIQVTLSTTDNDIQRAFDISNALAGEPFVNLQTGSGSCPNGNWKWDGFGVTKVDAVVTYVKVPSVTQGKGNNKVVVASGYAEYLSTNCREVSVPDLNEDGTYKTDPATGSLILVQVQACDFVGKPFNYCSRFLDAQGPDGNFADSGLRIYNADGTPVPVNDKTYQIKDCYLWRDVNKSADFSLVNFGTYDPDTANLLAPQEGTKDVGGLVYHAENNPDNFYTGECHQHGKENTGGNGVYSWNQSGPQRFIFNPDGSVAAGDPMCTGGSQLMDGTYP